MDTVALATIRVMMEINGTTAQVADINSHLAKTRNSIASGTKNAIASFSYKKAVFHGLFCMLTENDLYLQIASLHLYLLQIL